MRNTIHVDGHEAAVSYDSEANMLRGDFLGLNGEVEFYATDVESLKAEGSLSLQAYLAACREDGIEPQRHYSGRFNLRVSPELHRALSIAAGAAGQSINSLVARTLQSAYGDR